MYQTFLVALLLGSCLTRPLFADVTEDAVRKASPFKDFSLASVTNDAVLEKRMNTVDAPNIEVVQTCFVLKASPEKVASMILAWNPVGKDGLEISKHQTLASGSSTDAFRPTMKSVLDSSAGGWLVKQSLHAKDSSSELLLSPEEKAQLVSAGDSKGLVTAWSAILANRSAKGANSGASHFKTLIAAIEKLTGVSVSSPSSGAHYYWEVGDVDSRCTLSEGVSWKNSSPPQILDGEFFVTSEYSASFNCSTLWPVKIDGKQATLVWRIDSAISDQFVDLKGAERMASTGLIATSIKKTIAAFRQELSK